MVLERLLSSIPHSIVDDQKRRTDLDLHGCLSKLVSVEYVFPYLRYCTWVKIVLPYTRNIIFDIISNRFGYQYL